MASTIIDESSPLGDYFRADEDVDISPPRSGLGLELSASTGWTGHINAVAGPSRPSSASERTTAASSFSTPNTADAERFRFVVCSSGLLDKEFAPYIPVTPAIAPVALPDDLVPAAPVVQSRNISLVPASVALVWRRWDIGLAGLVLLAALGWLLGREALLLAVVGGGSVVVILRDRLLRGAHGAKVPPLATAPEKNSQTPPPDPASCIPTDQLKALILASRSLDSTVGAALSLLPHDPTALTPYHDLRLALHRMTDRMTDHLASANSQLSTLVNKDELSVMARMYDIELSRHSARHSLDQNERDGRADALAALEGRRRSPATVASPLKAFAMTPSASLPGRARPPHTQHLSLSAVPFSPLVLSPDDKFTSLPLRTPRPQRNSLRLSSPMLDEDATVRRPIRSNRSSWYGPRSGRASPDLSVSQPDARDRPHSPSPSLQSSSPYAPHRSSPLTDVSSLTRRTSVPIPLLLPTSTRSENEAQLQRPLQRYPSALSRTSTSEKRRSLQLVPYLRHGEVIRRAVSDEEDEPARIHTMPVASPRGKRRSLRDSMPHAWTLGSSLPSERLLESTALLPIHPTVPKPKLDRFPSISPLTLPALKASCLGVHLKRRKMACHLLSLRFDEECTDYWGDVRLALEELGEHLRKEVTELREAVDRATAESPLRPQHQSPVWAALPEWADSSNFAPRPGPEESILQHISSMRLALQNAWLQLEQANDRALTDARGLDDTWRAFRGTLGDLVRDTERGRDVIRQLHPPPPPRPPTEALDDLPPFLQAWAHDAPPDPSSSLGSGESSVPEELESNQDVEVLDDELLPRPGEEELFEADAAPLTTKERRARRQADEDERAKARADAMASGMVLDELRGVIESVKARRSGRAVGNTGSANDTGG